MQIAGQIAGVLACARRATRPARGLTDPSLLGRYIHACEVWTRGRVDSSGMNETLEDYRAIALHSPKSADAQGDLAENDAILQSDAPADQAAALRREADAAAARTLALDPASDEAYIARSLLAPPSDWAGRERLLRRGASVDPTWAESYYWLGLLFRDTGRLSEASEFLHKAVAGELEFPLAAADAEVMCEEGRTDQGISV